MKGNHMDIHRMTSECQARTLIEICLGNRKCAIKQMEKKSCGNKRQCLLSFQKCPPKTNTDS